MTVENGVELDSKEEGSEQDTPPAESQEGKDSIPKNQFLAALKNASEKSEREKADLQRQIDDLRASQNKAPPVKEPTRAELLELVKSGDLTQLQADSVWEKQIVERAKREAAAEAGFTANVSERVRKVEEQLSAYREVVGEAWIEGTAERKKVEKEFAHLVGLGYPGTKETEAAALRAAFGDIAILKASKSAKNGPADTHAETGGGKPAESKGADVLKTLDARQKAYYEAGIKRGTYANWGEVREELKYALTRKRA